MLELKSVKHAAFASEETHCYKANLYWKGKKVATVENGGYGGPDDIWWDDKATQAEVFDYADKNLRESRDPEFADLYKNASPASLLEMWCGHEVNKWLTAKDLKQAMSKRVIYTVKNDPALYQTKAARNAKVRDQWIPQVQAWDTTETVLNSLPFDEALTIYCERA